MASASDPAGGQGSAPERRWTRFATAWGWPLLVALLFALLAVYLFVCHYAKVYSDPESFVWRAMLWGDGKPSEDRAPVYPMVLYFLIRLMGRDWVFLSNLPFILVMAASLGWMTRRLWDASPGDARAYARLGFLASVALLVATHSRLLLELVNPFREPLAMALMAGSAGFLILGWRKEPRWGWRIPLAGLMLGLSTSVRETGLLLAFPMGLWMLAEMVAERKIRWASVLLFGIGMLVGLAPLLKHNLEQTGSALVPSYAAREVESMDEKPHWDIPIPGMALRHFRRTGPEIIERLRESYGPFAVGCLLLGAVVAAVRRQRQILLLHLPAMLLYMFFYSFYSYYKERYLLSACLFAIPTMAYGLAALVRGLEWIAGLQMASSAVWVRLAAMMLIAGAAMNELAQRLLEPAVRTKVWHLAQVREQILPHIKQPAIFLGGRHFAFSMRWILDQSFYEYERKFLRDRTPYASMDERLAACGAETIKRFASGNYYINEDSFGIGRNWLDRAPVFRFDELSVPFEQYGKPVSGNLYEVQLWQSPRHAFTVDRTDAGPALLMLDLRRIWDYPGRTYCRLVHGPDAETLTLTNAVQFLTLPAVSEPGRQKLLIESDQPVPQSPFARLIGLGEELKLSFGMNGRHWAWNLVSFDLYPGMVIPGDSCHLYDQGMITLPSFAATNQEVFAEFRIEFVQEHEYWRRQVHAMTAESGADRVVARLPGPRRQDQFTIGLGRGTGDLRMVPVRLHSTLPSHATQNTYPFWLHCRRNGFVKIYDARIFTLPAETSLPAAVDVGAAGDGPFIAEGFFPREGEGSRSSRWTGERAVLRCRLPAIEGKVAVKWTAFASRPDMDALVPAFFINGQRVADASVRRDRHGDRWEYLFEADSSLLRPDAWNTFAVELPTWTPSAIGLPDDRALGLHVDRLDVFAP